MSSSVPAAPLERLKYLIFAALALVIAVGIAVLIWRRPAPATIEIVPPGPTEIPTSTPTPGPFLVYMTGAVQQAETIVTLDYGSRVYQAIEAAGGALDSADLAQVNLAQVLEDGDQVQVPTRAPDLDAPDQPSATPIAITPTPGTLTVYVVGEVAQPESLVTLPQGSRVQDAIEAAGGAAANADLSQVNLSQQLNDGDYVYVPPLDGEPIQTPTPNHPVLVHVNSATPEELAALPGIGPSLADAIVTYRDENGPFTSLEDLDAVPGIGPAKLDAIRELVTFD
ncbi:ComEA family DNA-binding protein [Aggregatilinea lenta]|uniref:ComEA family DNA-binding protein n=1 Tax=Aggregatilinea lenta TaxID=913108 RepID=UPI0013C2C5C5|nr:ComEA family DNA-binding protein [Aggregatilinea lenta]